MLIQVVYDVTIYAQEKQKLIPAELIGNKCP